ncbi:MAG: winged helix-turn-helix transcriptional regulator [Ilumatobacteraceae bacterium]
MADYGKFCPVSMGAEVMADRWTPLILRELIMGSTRFNDIARGLPGISRSLLVQRLRHLERKGVLDRWPSLSGKGSEYHLTAAGADLERAIMAMGEWSVRWLYNESRPRDIDPITLTWWMHRRIDRDELPADRVTVQFNFTAPERVTTWVVLERREISVCKQPPGYDVDVVVTGETGDFGQIFAGVESWRSAIERGAVRIDGPPRFAQAIPRWFLTSPFADSMAEMARRYGLPGVDDEPADSRTGARCGVDAGVVGHQTPGSRREPRAEVSSSTTASSSMAPTSRRSPATTVASASSARVATRPQR